MIFWGQAEEVRREFKSSLLYVYENNERHASAVLEDI